MPGQRRDALTRGRVPHLDRLVVRPRDDAPAVGEDGDAPNLNPGRSHTKRKAEDAAPHGIRMPVQRRDALARGRVPHLDRLVVRPGDDAPAVGEDSDAADLKTEDHTRKKTREDAAPHVTRMPFQRRDALARGRVPHLDRLVRRPGDDAPAVGEDGDAEDLKDREITHTQEKQQRRRRATPYPNARTASRRTRPWPRPTP